jgi:hypothetical protein
MENRIYLKFLITHGVNEQPLPQITEAGAFIGHKWFYNESTKMASKYFEFEYALMAKDFATKQDLFDTAADDRMDLDDLIGRPALLEISKSAVANKDGVFNLNVKNFKPIPSSAQKVLLATYKTFAYAMDEKELKHITFPKAVYVDLIGGPSNGAALNGSSNGSAFNGGTPHKAEPYSYEEDTTEIPF